jgi:hypothetical protein
MFTSDPRDALVFAHERARRLCAGASGTRRALAASLRRAANRLDPAPLAPRPA